MGLQYNRTGLAGKAVGVFPPEGGDTYADDSHDSYPRFYDPDTDFQSEKQQPPLGKVTVVFT